MDKDITSKTIGPLIPFTNYNFLMKAKFNGDVEQNIIDKYTDMLRLSVRTATQSPDITLNDETLTGSEMNFNWPNCEELKCPQDVNCPPCATRERRKRKSTYRTEFFEFKYDLYPVQWRVKISGLDLNGNEDGYVETDPTVQDADGSPCRVYDQADYPVIQFENLRPGSTYKVEVIVKFNEFQGKQTTVSTNKQGVPEVINDIDAKVEVLYELETLDPDVNVLLLIDNTDAVDGRKEVVESVVSSLPLVLPIEQRENAISSALKNRYVLEIMKVE